MRHLQRFNESNENLGQVIQLSTYKNRTKSENTVNITARTLHIINDNLIKSKDGIETHVMFKLNSKKHLKIIATQTIFGRNLWCIVSDIYEDSDNYYYIFDRKSETPLKVDGYEGLEFYINQLSSKIHLLNPNLRFNFDINLDDCHCLLNKKSYQVFFKQFDNYTSYYINYPDVDDMDSLKSILMIYSTQYTRPTNIVRRPQLDSSDFKIYDNYGDEITLSDIEIGLRSEGKEFEKFNNPWYYIEEHWTKSIEKKGNI